MEKPKPRLPRKYSQWKPVFQCYVILPPKDKRINDDIKVCDRVVSVNDYSACMLDNWAPGWIGFFRFKTRSTNLFNSQRGREF